MDGASARVVRQAMDRYRWLAHRASGDLETEGRTVTAPLRITIPGAPRGKARARVTRFGAYTPAPTRNAEAFAKMCAVKAMDGRPPFEGALRVGMSVIVPIPESWSRKRKMAAAAGYDRPAKKPDASNVAKLVEDAFNGVVYRDDAQIVELFVAKHYGDQPRVEITVEQVEAAAESERSAA